MSPHAEAEFLLQAAAEVEHQFIVQYLYATYSLDSGAGGSAGALAGTWQVRLRTTAVEEMGHLLTVQNALLCIRSAPYLDRSTVLHTPNEPFALRLEPFSREFVGRFLVAESPQGAKLPAELQPLSQTIEHVGALYAMLYWLFQADDRAIDPWPLPTDGSLPTGRHLIPSDFADAATLANRINQAADWSAFGGVLVLPDITRTPLDQPDCIAAALRDAVAQVAAQGEGPLKPPAPGAPPPDSHFRRLSDIYTEVADLGAQGVALPVRPVPTDPTVGRGPAGPGAITEPSASAAARALNLRYTLLLQVIAAAVFTDNTRSVDGKPVVGTLAGWAVDDEMRGAIQPLSTLLVTLARTAGVPGSTAAAGPPFSPPDAPLPGEDRARWDNLIALLGQYKSLVEEVTSANPPLLTAVVDAIRTAATGDPDHLTFAQHARGQLFSLANS